MEESVQRSRQGWWGGGLGGQARALANWDQRSVGSSSEERERTEPSGVSCGGAGISHTRMEAACVWQKEARSPAPPPSGARLARATSVGATAWGHRQPQRRWKGKEGQRSPGRECAVPLRWEVEELPLEVGRGSAVGTAGDVRGGEAEGGVR